MANINNPPISTDPVRATWDLEVTLKVNELEGRLNTLLQAIKQAESLDDLKEKTKNI